MKVFVAHHPPAPRPDDFCFALDGELVVAPLVVCPDPRCGCDRSMAGIASARATTTFTVAELHITFTEYVAALRDGLARQGWWQHDTDDEWLLTEAVLLARDAGRFAPGVLLRIHRGVVVPAQRDAA